MMRSVPVPVPGWAAGTAGQEGQRSTQDPVSQPGFESNLICPNEGYTGCPPANGEEKGGDPGKGERGEWAGA